MVVLIVVSVSLTAALLVFGLFVALPAHNRAVKNRMVELGLHGREQSAVRHRVHETSRLYDLLQVMGQRLTRRERDFSILRARLVHAGFREPMALPLYLGTRSALTAGLFVLGTLFGVALEYSGMMITVVAVWMAIMGWFVPSFVLSMRITKRQKEIRKALPDALDLLVICVEAGLGLNQALIRVAAEMRHVSQLITEEIAQTNLEIRAGTPREHALLALADRTGVIEVRSLATMLIQTERFGTSIAKSLRIHAETLRTKRRQRAEEAAAKTTIKMVFPLALCIFPALFVVILGPALMQIFQTLSRM